MDVFRETIQTIGAVAAAIILVLRFWGEQHRVRTRVRLVEYAQMPGDCGDPDAQIRASIHNLGRDVQVVSAMITVATCGSAPKGVTLPLTLKRGEHLGIQRNYGDIEGELLSVVDAFGEKPPTSSDMENVQAQFECGEGHQHIAKLDRDSKKRLRAYLKAYPRAAAAVRFGA